MPDRKKQTPVAEQGHDEQATAKLTDRREQARQEALRRQRIEDLIRQAKAVVTGV